MITQTLFGFMKLKEPQDDIKNYILMFHHGILQKVNGKDCTKVDKILYYGSSLYMIENKVYNLDNVADIKEIPIPKYDGYFEDVTRYLEYMLRMTAGKYYNNNMSENCFECLRKANEIMQISPVDWLLKDYLRISQWMAEKGYVDEAISEQKHIFETLQNDKILNIQIQQYINSEAERKDNDRFEYYKILKYDPDKAPKSFGAYRTMKNKNTINYQKLYTFLLNKGFYNK